MKKILVLGTLLSATLVLTGCESTEEKAARLQVECTQAIAKNPLAGMQAKPCIELSKLEG